MNVLGTFLNGFNQFTAILKFVLLYTVATSRTFRDYVLLWVSTGLTHNAAFVPSMNSM